MPGGALMAFADSLGAICAFLNLPQRAATTTIESKTNFFRGVSSGEVKGVCRPLHVGRRFIVVQTDLADGQGRRPSRRATRCPAHRAGDEVPGTPGGRRGARHTGRR